MILTITVPRISLEEKYKILFNKHECKYFTKFTPPPYDDIYYDARKIMDDV